jgi:hypothetical protein
MDIRILSLVVSSAVLATAYPAESLAQSSRVEISKKDCQRIMRRHAKLDPTYRSGVNVRGKRVAPADLNGGSRLNIPDTISFDVKFDIRNFLGKPEADANAASTAAIAADKAKTAANAAATAATSAESAASAAKTIADTAKTASDAATAAVTAAKTAWDADPSNDALRTAYKTAQTDAVTAATTYSTALSDYNLINAQAVSARTNADSAASASTAVDKATFSAAAATAASSAASLGQTAAPALIPRRLHC